MHHDPRELIAIITKSVGRKLDVGEFDDRLMIQKGCYILNSMGMEPRYRFHLYVRGPYSSELADDYYELKDADFDVDQMQVPADAVMQLSEIFNKGLKYVEAYSTVLLIKNNNPKANSESIKERALEIKPKLKDEVLEASSLLLT